MGPDQERLVRESWQQLQPRIDAMATAFYARLFEIDPEAASRFATTDMAAQRRKFTEMLGNIVGMLDDPRRVVKESVASGRRHVAYGVRPREYETVGTALLWAMERELGESFTPEVRDAWRETYGLLAALMVRSSGPYFVQDE